MEELRFVVQGSKSEPCEVRFIRRDDGNLLAFCTCAAGAGGRYCVHRFKLMGGDAEGLLSANVDEVAFLPRWLEGTNVMEALKRLAAAETRMAEAKRQLAAAKKELAAATKP